MRLVSKSARTTERCKIKPVYPAFRSVSTPQCTKDLHVVGPVNPERAFGVPNGRTSAPRRSAEKLSERLQGELTPRAWKRLVRGAACPGTSVERLLRSMLSEGRMKPRIRNPKATVPGRKHPAEGQPVKGETGLESSRLCLISLKVEAALRREVDAYAEAHGITRSRAANHYLSIASETIRERDGVPSGKADELMNAIDGLRAAIDILGPPTFGMLRLMAHWSTLGGGVKVSEDELLAELRTVGADEWEQAMAEAERDLHEMSGTTEQRGRR
jgi:hypothetical protein